MIEKTITTKVSLEARTVALFVQTAGKFSSSVYLTMDEKTINGKSMMGVIALSVLDGQEITIKCEGVDEEVATEELAKFLLDL